MRDACERCGNDENLSEREGQTLCGECRGVCESCGAVEDVGPWTDGVVVMNLCSRCRLDGRLDEIGIEEGLLS